MIGERQRGRKGERIGREKERKIEGKQEIMGLWIIRNWGQESERGRREREGDIERKKGKVERESKGSVNTNIKEGEREREKWESG